MNIEKDVALSLLDFPVAKEPLFDKDQVELERFQAIRRQDTGKTLAVVSKHYKLLSHKSVLTPILEGLNDWTITRCNVENDGAKAFVELIKRDTTIDVGGKADTIIPRIVLINSYDKTMALRINYGVRRLVCSNGLTAPVKGFPGVSFRSVHVGDAVQRVKDVQRNLGVFIQNFGALTHVYNELANTAVLEADAKRIVEEIVGVRKAQDVLWKWTNGTGATGDKNAWMLYNAVTDYSTHDFKGAEALRNKMNESALEALIGLKK